MSDKPKASIEQRRYPRIYLQSSSRPQAPILGARLHWSGGQRLDVFDLSYVGVAALRASGVNGALGDHVRVQLELSGENEPLEIQGEIARLTERVVALRYANLETDARRALERFLHAKLLGLHMRAIDSRHFSPTATFTHWFHGPNNVDVFLWYESLTLNKAIVEIGGDFLKWKHGRFFAGRTRQVQDAEEDDYLKPLLDGEFEAETASETEFTPLMARALDMLSQIDDPGKVLQPLVDVLVRREKGA